MRILLVDDHAQLRRTIRDYLSLRPDWLVCGEAVDGLDAIDKALALRPDVIIMDISMPRMDGLEATRILRRDLPASHVIILSQHDPAAFGNAIRELNIDAYVRKHALNTDLKTALEKLGGEKVPAYSESAPPARQRRGPNDLPAPPETYFPKR